MNPADGVLKLRQVGHDGGEVEIGHWAVARAGLCEVECRTAFSMTKSE
jgi:hypothetical protein